MRGDQFGFVERYLDTGPAGKTLLLQRLDIPVSRDVAPADFLKTIDRTLLNERKVYTRSGRLNKSAVGRPCGQW